MGVMCNLLYLLLLMRWVIIMWDHKIIVSVKWKLRGKPFWLCWRWRETIIGIQRGNSIGLCVETMILKFNDRLRYVLAQLELSFEFIWSLLIINGLTSNITKSIMHTFYWMSKHLAVCAYVYKIKKPRGLLVSGQWSYSNP